MNLNEAQRICAEIEAKYASQRLVKQIKWTDVFSKEEDIVEALKNVYIPKSRIAPNCTFKGYEFIYSFAYYVQRGWTLTDKQLKQCKRLAVEIEKARAISEFKTDIYNR